MANQLEITTQYKDTAWVVTSKVADDSDVEFPRGIFLWTLDNTGALDTFQAIGHVDQVARYPLYDPNRTGNFGIHLVRTDESSTKVSTEQEAEDVKTVLRSAFSILLAGYTNVEEPVVELFPPSE